MALIIKKSRAFGLDDTVDYSLLDGGGSDQFLKTFQSEIFGGTTDLLVQLWISMSPRTRLTSPHLTA